MGPKLRSLACRGPVKHNYFGSANAGESARMFARVRRDLEGKEKKIGKPRRARAAPRFSTPPRRLQPHNNVIRCAIAIAIARLVACRNGKRPGVHR